jgi:hypothetical protein
MSSEQIGPFTGKITGQAVLDTGQDGTAKLEVSISDNGKFKGIREVSGMWTYLLGYTKTRWYTSYGEGQGVIMIKDGRGETATATGCGLGKSINTSGKMRHASAVSYRTVNSTDGGKKTAFFLNNIVGVNEYELDQSGQLQP